MTYELIKTPEELLEYMNQNIKYGFVNSNGKIYLTLNTQELQDAYRKEWRLSSPKRLLEVKYGSCWDQVELERDWFSSHGYTYKTLFIWFLFPYENSYSTHTYLIYKENEQWHYFEHSDASHRGIYSFKTLKEAIEYQKKLHIKSNRTRNPVGEEEIKRIHIYEFQTPKFGLSMDEYIDNIEKNATEINI